MPEDFVIDAHVPHAPWQWRIESPVEVRLELQGPLAAQAGAHFPDAKVERRGERTEVVLTVTLAGRAAEARPRAWPQARWSRPSPRGRGSGSWPGRWPHGTDASVSDVHERLRRLLFVVPYVARHRGVTVDALAKQLGVSREELLRDLELLTMVGRPPFQPDDFIDLHVENDRVLGRPGPAVQQAAPADRPRGRGARCRAPSCSDPPPRARWPRRSGSWRRCSRRRPSGSTGSWGAR